LPFGRKFPIIFWFRIYKILQALWRLEAGGWRQGAGSREQGAGSRGRGKPFLFFGTTYNLKLVV
jgi:hypothetical protein